MTVDRPSSSIYFSGGGPNAFQVNIACGLSDAIQRRRLSAETIQLVGKSVGALNVAYFAAGLCDQAETIYSPHNLRRLVSVQAIATQTLLAACSLIPQLVGSLVADGQELCRDVRRWIITHAQGESESNRFGVLNVDEAMKIVRETTQGDLRNRLRDSPIRAYVQVFNRAKQIVDTVDLRTCEDPEEALRDAITCTPLYPTDRNRVDAMFQPDSFLHLPNHDFTQNLCAFVMTQMSTRMMHLLSYLEVDPALSARLRAMPEALTSAFAQLQTSIESNHSIIVSSGQYEGGKHKLSLAKTRAAGYRAAEDIVAFLNPENSTGV